MAERHEVAHRETKVRTNTHRLAMVNINGAAIASTLLTHWINSQLRGPNLSPIFIVSSSGWRAALLVVFLTALRGAWAGLAAFDDLAAATEPRR